MTEVTARLRELATVEQAAERDIGAVQVVHPGLTFCSGGDVLAFDAEGYKAGRPAQA